MYTRLNLLAWPLSLLLCWTSAAAQEVAPKFERFTDEVLSHLPSNTQTLDLRGSHGYGIDQVTDVGISHLRHLKQLRTLRAVSLGLTDACLESISDIASLEELSLNGNSITGSGLQHLLKLKNLKRLDLDFNPLEGNWSQTVGQMSTLEALQAVDYDHPLNDSILENLSSLTQLTRLDLNDDAHGVTDVGIAALVKMPHLRSIRLSDAQVTSEGLSTLRSLSQLEVLWLRNLRSVNPGSFGWLPQLKRLTDVQIVGMPLNKEDLLAINQLSSVTSLLVWNVDSANDLPRFEQLDGLQSLRAIRTNAVIRREALDDLSKIATIEYIGDDLSEISDAEIASLSKLNSLRSMSLDSDKVTAKSLDSLKAMKSLRYLCVSDRVQLTAEQLSSLGREFLPKCKIVARLGNVVYHEPTLPID